MDFSRANSLPCPVLIIISGSYWILIINSLKISNYFKKNSKKKVIFFLRDKRNDQWIDSSWNLLMNLFNRLFLKIFIDGWNKSTSTFFFIFHKKIRKQRLKILDWIGEILMRNLNSIMEIFIGKSDWSCQAY